MEIDALTCKITIKFGRDLRKLLILCPSRRCLRLPAGLFKFHCRFQVHRRFLAATAHPPRLSAGPHQIRTGKHPQRAIIRLQQQFSLRPEATDHPLQFQPRRRQPHALFRQPASPPAFLPQP